MKDESLLAGLAQEFVEEIRAGKLPSLEEYVSRYPHLGQRIRGLFPTLKILEEAAANREISQPAVGRARLSPGSIVGSYRIQREIGRGGMGIVYEAVQVSTQKSVALKILPLPSTVDPRHLERFYREARITADLNHPNIVPIIDVGQMTGAAYYAMPYIEGRGLDCIVRLMQKSKNDPASQTAGRVRAGVPEQFDDYLKWVVDIGIQAARGLAYAHDYKLIHRDIKPSNLLLGDNGTLWIVDFGLARSMDDPALTMTGTVLGTPRYMSPEQTEAKRVRVDHRSDIYSLGATLYELLTCRPVFEGETAQEILLAIILREPEAPHRLNAAIPADLETVVMKTLAKHPDERYQSAMELADDLQRWLRMEPIKARRIGLLGRVRSWCIRNVKHNRNDPYTKLVRATHAPPLSEKEMVLASGAKLGPYETEPQPSIAVLPFVNMSGDKEQEYFSDGLAEEIINALTQIPGLIVIARTSAFAFKGKQEDVRNIAEVLGVSNILEGSVRKSGNRIRVTAQLIDALRGAHLWSQRYDREATDVFAIQDEIAAAIAGTLQVKLSPSPRPRYEPNPAAYEAYLRARYFFGKHGKESSARCKGYFEQAIELDPGFALAHCGYADYFLFLSGTRGPTSEFLPLIKAEAEKALNIDPSLPEAHALLGVAAVLMFDWNEAEKRFRLALARESVSPLVRQWYGLFYLLLTGRIKEAVEQQEQAVKADPLNILARNWLAYSLFIDGRLADAILEAQKVLELETNHGPAAVVLALIYARQEQWTEALSFAEKASVVIPYSIGILGGVLMRMGQVDRATGLIRNLLPGKFSGALTGLFYYYLICGETSEAVKWLQKAIEHRDVGSNVATMHFRSTSQWPAIAKLMNLPE